MCCWNVCMFRVHCTGCCLPIMFKCNSNMLNTRNEHTAINENRSKNKFAEIPSAMRYTPKAIWVYFCFFWNVDMICAQITLKDSPDKHRIVIDVHDRVHEYFRWLEAFSCEKRTRMFWLLKNLEKCGPWNTKMWALHHGLEYQWLPNE